MSKMSKMQNKKEVIVIFSGGFDSSLCLYNVIKKRGQEKVLALSFNYGQSHGSELGAAQFIAKHWNVDHQEINLGFLKEIAHSSLTQDDLDMNGKTSDQLNVILPGRNGLFIRISGILGHKLGAFQVVTGVNETDSPDFPDCRRSYMDKLEELLKIDFNQPSFSIETPLTGLTKGQIYKMARDVGILDFLLEHSISCYNGVGKMGCGQCPSCLVKRKGLEELEELER